MKTCRYCQAPLMRKRFSSGRLEDNGCFQKRVFCNRSCMGSAFEGVIKVMNPQNSRRQSAKVRATNCEVCNRRGHHVHHRDENPMNNDASNLQTLCASCHRLSHEQAKRETLGLSITCFHCSSPSYRRGLCHKHLSRLRRYGNPLAKKFKIGSEWILKIETYAL